jgi:uncharacterized membrane protein YidH (DUF202 family)
MLEQPPSQAEKPKRPLAVSVGIFVLSLAIFAAFAAGRLRGPSTDPHFVYLADSYLHGTIEMRQAPPHGNDWATVEVLTLRSGEVLKGMWWDRSARKFMDLRGRLYVLTPGELATAKTSRLSYVSFPPLPAVLMMPFVAVWGLRFNDVLFTVVMAALNVTLAWGLLRQLAAAGLTKLSTGDRGWLVALFGFGTAHLWCSVLGQVWFTALIVGVTCNLLYIRFSLDAERPFLAGLALAAAFATRASLLFAFVFFVHQLWWPSHGRRPAPREAVRKLVLFGLPCVATGVLLLVYNSVRFENPTEFGHTYLATGTIARIRDFGLFDLHFLSRNLTAALTLLPSIDTEAPYLHLSKHGMSLLLTTPALVWLLWPMRTHALARSLGIGALTIAVPIFFYQNTGWEQYGFRFSLDFMPYLVGLLALGGRPINRAFKTLIIIGILVNAFGAVTFKRGGMPAFYNDYLCEEPK